MIMPWQVRLFSNKRNDFLKVGKLLNMKIVAARNEETFQKSNKIVPTSVHSVTQGPD